jgi:mannose-1-phosphate guanylyltransferase
MVTKVAEPSAYGVVVTKPNSTVIDRFVEKPVEFVGNRINAGIYMFNPSVLDRIEVSYRARDWSSGTHASPARRRLRRRSSRPSLRTTSCTLSTSRASGWTSDNRRTS